MKSVVFCGSRRFKKEMYAFADHLRELGVFVLVPYLYDNPAAWEVMPDEQKRFTALGLTYDHFYKIELADVVFIFNQDGYMGPSTTMELGYAIAAKKPVYALAKDEEWCRYALFREVVETPYELAKRLI